MSKQRNALYNHKIITYRRLLVERKPKESSIEDLLIGREQVKIKKDQRRFAPVLCFITQDRGFFSVHI